ncbi:cold shock protein [Saccharomonospora marina XMU15]|uniref:Cold shock protein n=1 Tax=Saccharomonospora marina XMU15 TaxID=882083 RepID=H5X846_9PSEU|nr:cold shock domain-containing protein [Saccharomonospora marina]EHR53578.1 cold shock protein [Saccharomonospora marina XMU15]
MAHGTVKFFNPEEGWGTIASPDLPAGFDAWVHYSAIELDGFRELQAGEAVEFSYEEVQQDGFCFRATSVRKA